LKRKRRRDGLISPVFCDAAAERFARSISIFFLDFFAVCFIMVLCKLNFAWTFKKPEKQPILAQKQPIFGLQKSWHPIKSGEKSNDTW